MSISCIGMNSDAAYGMMRNSEAMLSMSRGASGSEDTRALSQKEKGLQIDNLNNQVTYSATELMEESQKKAQKENFKRAFSYFA